MAKFYFTFGSDPEYPFGQNDFVEIEAEDGEQACDLFRVLHPNRPCRPLLNCAFIYCEETFNKFRDQYYKGVEPVETIAVKRHNPNAEV